MSEVNIFNLRNESTQESHAIWAEVDRAARQVPAWTKPRIERAAAEAREMIVHRLAKMV